MARILYVIPRAEHGGTQQHVYDLARSFRDEHDVMVVTGERGPLTTDLESAGVPVAVVDSLTRNASVKSDPAAYRAIRAIVRNEKIDLLHAHNSKAGLVGRWAARREAIPALYTAHGWAFAPGAPAAQRIQSWVAERIMSSSTARVITVSEADRRLAIRARLGPAERFVTIHNGIPDQPAPARKTRDEPLRILMVGRFVRQKDQMLLAKAAKGLDCVESITFIGDGPDRPAFEEAWKSEIASGRIVVRSRVPAMEPYLEGANCFALISRWEGLPISILEAMRTALPVVATNVGGVSEMVEDGVSGRLVRPGDEAHLRTVLAGLTNLGAQGRAGRRIFEQRFTLEKQVGATLQLMEEVLLARS